MQEFPDDCDDVEYYKWAKADGKAKKAVKSFDVEEAIELFTGQVKISKAHIFVKRTQNIYYSHLKENLKTNEFMIHVDCSKNYKEKTKSKVLILVIYRFQYLQRVATHAGFMVHS